jgi:hypothetical protein
VEPRELLVRVSGPRARQAAGEVVLLREEVVRAVAHPPRLDEHDLGGRRGVAGDVGDQHVLVHEPRQPALHAVEERAFREPLPLLATPRLVRHECSRMVAHVVARHDLAGGEDQHLGQVVSAALVVHRELGEAINLVAPQVDPDRRVARWTGTRR